MSKSYRQIFKTSSLLGGAQIIVLLIGMVRSKALALLIGPAGTGLVGMYSSTTTIVSTLAGMGIRSSGVRQIATSVAENDQVSLARTVKVLRWSVRVTGVLGGIIMLVFCKPLSRLTFGDNDHVLGMALMSLVLIFEGISSGQWALLQGLRRIGDLAKAKIYGALFGAVVSIVMLSLWGEKGIIPFIISASFFSILVSWWFARSIEMPAINVTLRQGWADAKVLLSLGTAFLISGILGSGLMYFSRLLVIREFSTVGVGLYTSSLALSNLFVSFVLDAMGKDFYPRLTAAANNNEEMNCLVNEQTEMALLLSSAGILGMFALAPLLLTTFYSQAYLGAVEVLRWQLLGMLLKVVSWPMGFIQLAKANRRVFIATEVTFVVINICVLVIGIKTLGLAGAGVATFISYAVYILIMTGVAFRLSRFHWSASCLRTLLPIILAATLSLICVSLLNSNNGMLCSLLISVIIGLWSFFRLKHLLDFDPLAFIKTRWGKNRE